jgi:hypothetical protein
MRAQDALGNLNSTLVRPIRFVEPRGSITQLAVAETFAGQIKELDCWIALAEQDSHSAYAATL